jgi:capsule polysaccharide export protein KpsE/RkpR
MSEMKRNAELLEMVDGLQKEIVKLESWLDMCDIIKSNQASEIEGLNAEIELQHFKILDLKKLAYGS